MGVGYDLLAADRLRDDLDTLNGLIKRFVEAREGARKSNLDAPDAPPNTVPWTGGRRNDFDAKLRAQQAELLGLADLVLILRGRVEDASNAFKAATKTG